MKKGFQSISPKIIYIALTVLFVLLITLSNQLLRNYRIDMTENNVYTLSDSTYQVLAKIDQPINLYLYFSQQASENRPEIRTYYTRVKEMLEEFALHADGKINLKLVDPEPFSEEEERAASLGLQNVPVAGVAGQTFYFALVGSNAVGVTEKIPYIDLQRETFLEYDIDKMIYALINTKKPVLGLITSLPMHEAGLNLPGLPSGGKAWAITNLLEQRFDVKLLFFDEVQEISSDIDVLMVVHPKFLDQKALYAIDQYMVRGGKGIFFVDPYSITDQIPLPAGIDISPQDVKARSSTLNPLFQKWGFRVPEKKVVGDLQNALSTTAPGKPPERNIAYVGLQGAESLDNEDVTTAKLNRVNFVAASYVEVINTENVEMTSLLRTSKQSNLLSVEYMRFLGQPSLFLDNFVPNGTQYPLVARIKAQINSAFDKAPEIKKEKGSEEEEGEEEKPYNPPEYMAKSEGKVDMVVVADVDVLSDQMWIQTRKMFNQTYQQPFASNGDMVINMIDNLTGDEALIGLRGRTVYRRPFTKVNELRQLSDQRYRAAEKGLQRDLSIAQNKLQELQNKRADSNSSIMTPEQQAEVAKMQQQVYQTRRELRDVKHKLGKEIDALGNYIKAINIGLMPLLLSLVTLLFVWLRNRRHRRKS